MGSRSEWENQVQITIEFAAFTYMQVTLEKRHESISSSSLSQLLVKSKDLWKHCYHQKIVNGNPLRDKTDLLLKFKFFKTLNNQQSVGKA